MDDCEWATDWPTNWEGEWPGEWDWSKEWPWAGDWAVLKEWASGCLASILKGPPVKSVSKAFEALPKPVLRFMKEVGAFMSNDGGLKAKVALAQAAVEDERYQEANDAALKAVDTKSQCPEAQFFLGCSYYGLGTQRGVEGHILADYLEDALDAFQDAADNFVRVKSGTFCSESADAMTNRAAALWLLGARADAIKSLRKTLRDCPGHGPSRALLTVALIASGTVNKSARNPVSVSKGRQKLQVQLMKFYSRHPGSIDHTVHKLEDRPPAQSLDGAEFGSLRAVDELDDFEFGAMAGSRTRAHSVAVMDRSGISQGYAGRGHAVSLDGEEPPSSSLGVSRFGHIRSPRDYPERDDGILSGIFERESSRSPGAHDLHWPSRTDADEGEAPFDEIGNWVGGRGDDDDEPHDGLDSLDVLSAIDRFNRSSVEGEEDMGVFDHESAIERFNSISVEGDEHDLPGFGSMNAEFGHGRPRAESTAGVPELDFSMFERRKTM